ncbi:hypothetical protein ES702_02800 [subsurface metagenome]
MVLQTKERPLSGSIEYADNTTKRIEVDRDNLIRRMAMLFSFSVTTATTPATGIIEDDLLNAVKKIRLVMDADDNKFNVDLSKWLFVEQVEKGTLPPRDAFAIPATVTTTVFKVLVNADFAQARQNLSDVSALLDAPNKSSLFLEIDWGSIADVVVTVQDTIIDTATNVKISLTEVFDDEGAEANAQLATAGFIDLREGTDRFDITKAYTSFDDSTLQQQIEPVPANILTHLLVTKEDVTSVSGTPTRNDSVLNQIKVENIKGVGEKIIQTSWDQAHLGNKSEYGLEAIQTGVAYIDWIDQRRGGLANFVAEAIKWRFLAPAPTATETNAIELYTRYVSGVAQ